MYALVDCNNFYCSCERVFNPALKNRPIVVLSNNDGCVIARSNEAKSIGIPMGAPAFKYEPIFRQYDVQVYSANFALYGDMSRRVMSILAQYSPEQEVYSIDECFLSLSGIDAKYSDYGRKMCEQVLRWTDIPISVGIAPTKALAKLANRIAKKFPQQCRGVHVIDSEDLRIKALKWLRIEDVWGIGRRHAKKLHSMGVVTAYDFTLFPESIVRGLMTIVGLNLHRDLRGIPTIKMEFPQLKQSITTTRTFEQKYFTFSDVKERIVAFVTISAEKLRQQNSMCRSMLVFIETSRFEEPLYFYSRFEKIKLPYPTSSTLELIRFAVSSLEKIFKSGYGYKRAGVSLFDFVQMNEYQPSLFFNSNPKHVKLMRALDAINEKYPNSVHSAAFEKKHRMKQVRLSRKFTTDINELIEVLF